MSADLRTVIVSLVPRKWTPQQAHNAVHLLQQGVAAIWHVHGEAMGKLVLGDLPPRSDEPAKPPRADEPARQPTKKGPDR